MIVSRIACVALSACMALLLTLLLVIAGDAEARSQAQAQAAREGSHEDTTSFSAGMDPSATKVFPLAVITNNFDLVSGQAYPLIFSDTVRGRSNLGVLDLNGHGVSATVMRGWLACGYNPAITQTDWENWWCPQYRNSYGWGPTRYWLDPDDGPYFAPTLRAGAGMDGWWLRGSPDGAVNYSRCTSFAEMDQQEYIIPLVDIVVPGGGTDNIYHLRALPTFRIHKTDTVCYPPPGESQRWYVEGVFMPR